MRQQSFLPKLRTDHGGDLGRGRRKRARPFSHKNAIHVVFRSSRARGIWSLLTRGNEERVRRLLRDCATKHRIRVYRLVNVGNHIHLLIRTESRAYAAAKADFQRFLREFGGRVAFEVTGARKGAGQGGFWDKLVYTRLVTWGREFEGLKSYLVRNLLESFGFGREGPDWLRAVAESLMAAGVGPPS